MDQVETQNCSITYKTAMVIIRGENRAIHAQANIIIRRFALSAVHYGITRDSNHTVVLKACH